MTTMTRGPARKLPNPARIHAIAEKVSMDVYALLLKEGKEVDFRPHGNSMSGLIENGDLVHIVPYTNQVLKLGDIVLCHVVHVYLHKITKIEGRRIQIGNNKGRINGWTNLDLIYGICTHINGIARD